MLVIISSYDELPLDLQCQVVEVEQRTPHELITFFVIDQIEVKARSKIKPGFYALNICDEYMDFFARTRFGDTGNLTKRTWRTTAYQFPNAPVCLLYRLEIEESKCQ